MTTTRSIAALLAAAAIAASVAACAPKPAAEPEPEPTTTSAPAPTTTSEPQPVKIIEGTPVLFFVDDPAVEQLRADMEAGRIPVECNVLYDQMGGRPEVIVTDEPTIREIFDRLSHMIVLEGSNFSITDSYHHVIFTLQDGTKVGFGFEGEGLLSLDGKNYGVSDEGGIWAYVRELQDDAMAGKG